MLGRITGQPDAASTAARASDFTDIEEGVQGLQDLSLDSSSRSRGGGVALGMSSGGRGGGRGTAMSMSVDAGDYDDGDDDDDDEDNYAGLFLDDPYGAESEKKRLSSFPGRSGVGRGGRGGNRAVGGPIVLHAHQLKKLFQRKPELAEFVYLEILAMQAQAGAGAQQE